MTSSAGAAPQPRGGLADARAPRSPWTPQLLNALLSAAFKESAVVVCRWVTSAWTLTGPSPWRPTMTTSGRMHEASREDVRRREERDVGETAAAPRCRGSPGGRRGRGSRRHRSVHDRGASSSPCRRCQYPRSRICQPLTDNAVIQGDEGHDPALARPTVGRVRRLRRAVAAPDRLRAADSPYVVGSRADAHRSPAEALIVAQSGSLAGTVPVSLTQPFTLTVALAVT